MNTAKNIASLLLLATCFITCEDNDPAVSPADRKPEPTAVGTPSGAAVTKVIGPDGGSISSSDERFQLEFPVGALSTDTEITVEPITNNAHGGRGNGYRLGPDGSTFSKPVALTMHYDANDLAGTLPGLLGIAFQDNDGIWYSLGAFTWNTTDQTISAGITHFTDFATFAHLHISSYLDLDAVKVNESAEFRVLAIYKDPDLLASLIEGSDDLAPLYPYEEVMNTVVKNWAANGVVNGNSQYGSISPDGSRCTYNAPATKPGGSKNPVQLSADINMKYRDPLTGTDFNNLTLVTPVQILDNDADFKVELLYEIAVHTISGVRDVTGSDKTEFTISVENGVVSVSNITNYSTTLDSSIGVDIFGCTNSVAPGAYDILNVSSGSAQLFWEGTSIHATLTLETAKTPRWKVECPEGDPLYFGGQTVSGMDLAIPDFPVVLKNDTTMMALGMSPWKFTVKPQ